MKDCHLVESSFQKWMSLLKKYLEIKKKKDVKDIFRLVNTRRLT